MGNTEVAEDVGGYDKVGKLEAPCDAGHGYHWLGGRRRQRDHHG